MKTKTKLYKGFIIWCVLMLSIGSITSCKSGTKKDSSTKFTLDCCGTATLYSDKKLAVSGCSFFTCTKKTGRWAYISGGYSLTTTDGKFTAVAQASGNKMYIVVI